jgi:translation initiation factor 1
VSNDRLVYSTGDGDLRERDGSQRGKAHRPAAPHRSDGIVRVSREKTGRRGKTVTVVRGLPSGDLRAVSSDLKRHCGSGGAVKEGAIEVQGDHRDKVAQWLTGQGRQVKLAGG